MDPRVTELHYVLPIGNVPSVLEHGILSHERAARLRHHAVPMPPIQDGRDVKSVPQGRTLHEYANLYFHARNPMAFQRTDECAGLCVLRITTAVLDQPGTVIADGNASSDYVRYLAPSQSDILNFNDIYADDWRHPDDPLRAIQHSSRKCSEVLVPERVEPTHLTGAYVADSNTGETLKGAGFTLPITIDPSLFRP